MDVELYDAANVLVETVTSNAAGYKDFQPVTAGSYKVCEVLQSGWYVARLMTRGQGPTYLAPLQFAVTKTILNDNDFDFGNVKSPIIQIVKAATPTDAAATFSFTEDVTAGGGTFSLLGSNVPATAQKDFTVKVGTKYTFEEANPIPNWMFKSLGCVVTPPGLLLRQVSHASWK